MPTPHQLDFREIGRTYEEGELELVIIEILDRRLLKLLPVNSLSHRPIRSTHFDDLDELRKAIRIRLELTPDGEAIIFGSLDLFKAIDHLLGLGDAPARERAETILEAGLDRVPIRDAELGDGLLGGCGEGKW